MVRPVVQSLMRNRQLGQLRCDSNAALRTCDEADESVEGPHKSRQGSPQHDRRATSSEDTP